MASSLWFFSLFHQSKNIISLSFVAFILSFFSILLHSPSWRRTIAVHSSLVERLPIATASFQFYFVACSHSGFCVYHLIQKLLFYRVKLWKPYMYLPKWPIPQRALLFNAKWRITWVELCLPSPQKISWCLKPHYLRMWPYYETGSLGWPRIQYGWCTYKNGKYGCREEEHKESACELTGWGCTRQGLPRMPRISHHNQEVGGSQGGLSLKVSKGVCTLILDLSAP